MNDLDVDPLVALKQGDFLPVYVEAFEPVLNGLENGKLAGLLKEWRLHPDHPRTRTEAKNLLATTRDAFGACVTALTDGTPPGLTSGNPDVGLVPARKMRWLAGKAKEYETPDFGRSQSDLLKRVEGDWQWATQCVKEMQRDRKDLGRLDVPHEELTVESVSAGLEAKQRQFAAGFGRPGTGPSQPISSSGPSSEFAKARRFGATAPAGSVRVNTGESVVAQLRLAEKDRRFAEDEKWRAEERAARAEAARAEAARDNEARDNEGDSFSNARQRTTYLGPHTVTRDGGRVTVQFHRDGVVNVGDGIHVGGELVGDDQPTQDRGSRSMQGGGATYTAGGTIRIIEGANFTEPLHEGRRADGESGTFYGDRQIRDGNGGAKVTEYSAETVREAPREQGKSAADDKGSDMGL